jgi:hypothetical protein
VEVERERVENGRGRVEKEKRNGLKKKMKNK